jgi:hypothetical protein
MSDIVLVGSEATEIPDWFRRRLRDIDRALVVYFNPFRRVFCIDRCVRGQDCLLSEHLPCEKTNVMLFEHIGEAAIEKLKSMDAWTKFGGNDEAALLRFRREHEIAKEEFDAKRLAEAKKSYKDVQRDERLAVNHLKHLVEQHDIARVHK